MGTGTEPEVLPPALRAKVDQAEAACHRAWVALVALAEALGTPGSVPVELARAEAVLGQARMALSELEVAREAAVSPAEARGTLGDEDPEWLQQHGARFEALAAALEREERRARQRQQWFWAWHGPAMGLMVLCAIVLSVDSARAALGVAEDSHLLLALAAVVASCQVAWQGLGIARHHLATAAARQRDMAQRLRHRARQVVDAKDSAEAAAATNKATAAVLRRLEEVTLALGTLVAAVTRDREVTTCGTRGQGFPNAARALGDIVVALGTSGEGHKDVARRLEVAQGALAGLG